MGEKQGHTPGPWHVCDADIAVNPFIVVDDANMSVADCACFSTRREANARLIAAAPDLLEALRQVMGWIDGWDPNFIHDADWPETAHHIRAAISRATGEDSPANEGLA